MKRLFALLAVTVAFAAQAETNVGLAYGRIPAKGGASLFTDHKTFLSFDFWVAGTETGPLLGNFDLFDTGTGAGAGAAFHATSIRSFRAYYDPFFGKVADFWLDGVYGQANDFPITTGRTTVAHVRVTESAAPVTVAYMTFDVYLPGNLSAPIFSRVAFILNSCHVLIPPGAGLAAGMPAPSGKGMIWGTQVLSLTNRMDALFVDYNIAFNGIQHLSIGTPFGGIDGTRLISFACANDGIFGKQADVWCEGQIKDGGSAYGRTAIVHLIVTHSAAIYGWDLVYVATYIPGHLDVATYERVGVVIGGHNNILCR